jgi:hypothetical protein
MPSVPGGTAMKKRNGSMSLAKVAVIRHQGYPPGVVAPLFLRCHCGARPSVKEATVVTCYGCGAKYDRTGWLLDGEVPV